MKEKPPHFHLLCFCLHNKATGKNGAAHETIQVLADNNKEDKNVADQFLGGHYLKFLQLFSLPWHKALD
jgi:hypothetical protein